MVLSLLFGLAWSPAPAPAKPAPAKATYSAADTRYTLTAYCACAKCCGKWADGITATGTHATEGLTVAVDPKVIPLGSTVVINGHSYIAEDTGVKGHHIDIFFDSHHDALVFGVQKAEVTFYKEVT